MRLWKQLLWNTINLSVDLAFKLKNRSTLCVLLWHLLCVLLLFGNMAHWETLDVAYNRQHRSGHDDTGQGVRLHKCEAACQAVLLL